MILGVNPCFWAKNRGRWVNLWGLGEMGKKKVAKICEKMRKIEKSCVKIVKNWDALCKN
ncbi:hypothetical protein ES703_37234 [subsurface metagenome]